MKSIKTITNLRRMPRLGALLGVTICLSLSADPAGPRATTVSAPVPNPAAEFREFVSNAYSIKHRSIWIQKIVFRVTNKYWTGVMGGYDGTPRHEFTYPGFSEFEASIQPHGFYLKTLKNPFAYATNYNGKAFPFQPLPGREDVTGASGHDFWGFNWMHASIWIAPRSPYPGASLKNNARGVDFLEIAAHLDPILFLGLDNLIGSKIEWTDSTHFTAVSGGHRTGYGKILRFSNAGQPLLVRYKVTGKPEGSEFRLPEYGWHRVAYSYKPGRAFPPYQMVGYTEGSEKRFVNFIDACEFGANSFADDGYKISDFMKSAESFKVIVLSSNGVDYLVQKSGELTLPNYYKPPKIAKASGPPSNLPTALSAIVILAGMASASWLILKKKRINQQKELNYEKTKNI